MTGFRPWAASLVAVVSVAAAAGALHARDGSGPLAQPEERALYLGPGRGVGRMFLAFDSLASDVYWIRTIQHYGRDRKSSRVDGRFALLQPLLDLTTTLDPHFNIAYRFGAIFLSADPPEGPGRPDAAISLLEKGLEANPGRWQYAYDIGFVDYWYAGRQLDAATWFERASMMPGAPEWLKPLAGVTLVAGGDRAGARELLGELRASPQPYLQHAAARGLAQVDALDALDRLQALVDAFAQSANRPASSWADLVESGRLARVPVDPTGTPFVLDPVTSRVSLSGGSSLNPLPKTLGHP
jgi:hypothetical protein